MTTCQHGVECDLLGANPDPIIPPWMVATVRLDALARLRRQLANDHCPDCNGPVAVTENDLGGICAGLAHEDTCPTHPGKREPVIHVRTV